jgi:hypothetical protein
VAAGPGARWGTGPDRHRSIHSGRHHRRRRQRGPAALPDARYLLFSGIGASLWTGYGIAVGILGRTVFPDNAFAAAAAAVCLALAAGAGVQWWRRARRRQR